MKAKRLVALLLAIVMVVGLFAMSASAYTCSKCHRVDYYSVKPAITNNYAYVNSCSNKNSPHNHYITRYLTVYTCTGCGHVYEYQRDYDEDCPYA